MTSVQGEGTPGGWGHGWGEGFGLGGLGLGGTGYQPFSDALGAFANPFANPFAWWQGVWENWFSLQRSWWQSLATLPSPPMALTALQLSALDASGWSALVPGDWLPRIDARLVPVSGVGAEAVRLSLRLHMPGLGPQGNTETVAVEAVISRLGQEDSRALPDPQAPLPGEVVEEISQPVSPPQGKLPSP